MVIDMFRIKKKAYAKINLCLNTLYKREDSYHELEMLMVNIDLYDILYFKKSDKVRVKMDKDVCKMEDNLVYKTAMYIKNKYNLDKGIDIKIKKNIPDQAGLGGGSSDAACTILALNKLWNLNLNNNDLIDIANHIGSDVTFFLFNKLSIVRGRGEQIEFVDKKFEENILLFIPEIKSSTKLIYQNHIIEKHDNKVVDLISNLDKNYYDYMFNDLEKTASTIYPEYKLQEIKQILKNIGSKTAMMSGSGSAVFGIGINLTKKEIKDLKEKYNNYSIYYCKTISSCK